MIETVGMARSAFEQAAQERAVDKLVAELPAQAWAGLEVLRMEPEKRYVQPQSRFPGMSLIAAVCLARCATSLCW